MLRENLEPSTSVSAPRTTAAPDVSVQFDPALMESVVTRALAAGSAGPAGFTSDAFHAEADRIYRSDDPSRKSALFRELFGRWFGRGQFDRPVRDALAEMPA